MVRKTRVPGEEPQDGPLNNAMKDDPNQVAASRERLLQAIAMGATGGEGEIAPGPALDSDDVAGPVEWNGEKVQVRVPVRRVNAQVEKFGGESKLPRGTAVRKDGTPCEGAEKPFGYIGNIQTRDGILINRVIPVAVLEAANLRAK